MLFPVRLKVNAFLVQQKIELIEILEEKTGHGISYGSIAPSILHAFEIRDLKIASNTESGSDLLKIEKLRLQFNLFKFKFTNPLNTFSGLLIVNSQIEWDHSKKGELLELISSITSNNNSKTKTDMILPPDFTIRGRNIGIVFNNVQVSAVLEHLFFTLGTTIENDLSISIKADSSFSFEQLPDSVPIDNIEVSTDLRLSGRIDSDFKWANLKIETKDFKSTIFSIDKLSWNFNYTSPGLLKLTKIGDNIPVDFTLKADTNNNIFEAEIQSQDFIFNQYFSTSDLPAVYNSITESVISGIGAVEFHPDTRKLNYSGDFTVKNLGGILEKPLNISADFSGKNKSIMVTDSLISSDIGEAGFSGSIDFTNPLPLINGYLNVPGITFRELSFSSNMILSSSEKDGYSIAADYLTINRVNLADFKISFLPYEENIEYKVETDLITGRGNPDHLFSEGIIQIGREYYIQAMLSTDGLLISPVINGIQDNFIIPEVFDGFELSSEIFLSGTLEQLSFASPQIKIADRNNDKHSLSFALSGNNSGFRLTDLDLIWDQNEMNGNISSDFSDSKALILQTSLNLNGTPFNTSGVWNPDGSLSLSGDFDLEFNLYKPENSGYKFSFQTSRLPVTLTEDSSSYLSINTNGFFDSAADWKILIDDFIIQDIPTGYGNGNLELRTLLSPEGGSIYKLAYNDRNTKLQGEGSILLSEITPFPTGRAYISLSSQVNGENYELLIDFGKSSLAGSLSFNGFPLLRISPEFPFSGDINGNLSIAGTPSSPELRLLVNTGNAVFNNERLQLDAALNYNRLKLQIEDISGSYGSFSFNKLEGLIDLENGIHNITGGLTSDSRIFKFDAGLTADIKTQKINTVFDIKKLATDDFKADISIDKITLNDEKKDPWSVDIVRREKLMNITAGSTGELTASYFEDGYFSLSAVKPFPAIISASGTIQDGSINATMSDLQYEFDNLKIPFFIFYRGSLSGNVRIQGPLNDPDFYGRLDFKDMELKPPIAEERTLPFSPSFYFSGKEITLPATRLKTTNGIIDINSTGTMEQWLPRNYDINITIPKGDEISAIFYKKPIYIYGFGSGIMHLYGDLSHMWIDGDINVSETVFMINSNLDFTSSGNSGGFITSKMNFNLGENNQFFWPTQDLPIVKGFLQAGSKLSMIYDTAAGGLLLNGDLNLNGGEIFYFERNFYIKEGAVKFINSTRESMDPLLSTRAEIRDINSEGEMTRIYLIVDQSPLSSFTPRFSSDPPLSTSEIISMLGGNIFENFQQENFDLTNALLLTTDIFTQFAIIKEVEDRLKTSLGLDLLSIRSSFLSNFIENTFFTSSGELTQDNFANYLDNTTLFLGKYFTDDIFLQGMFQFDLYNDTGYSENPDLNLDSEIKLEWEGPIANVELSFYPDFVDPIAGFNKTSVGLSWRFSY